MAGPVPAGKRRSWSEKLLEYIIRVIVIAIMIVFVMPAYIAPTFFHVTTDEYLANEFYFTIIAVILAIPVAWLVTKILSWGIKGGIP